LRDEDILVHPHLKVKNSSNFNNFDAVFLTGYGKIVGEKHLEPFFMTTSVSGMLTPPHSPTTTSKSPERASRESPPRITRENAGDLVNSPERRRTSGAAAAVLGRSPVRAAAANSPLRDRDTTSANWVRYAQELEQDLVDFKPEAVAGVTQPRSDFVEMELAKVEPAAKRPRLTAVQEEVVVPKVRNAADRRRVRNRGTYPDRFIPDRNVIFRQPGAEMFAHPRPAAPQSEAEHLYRERLGDALWKMPMDPYAGPVLRKVNPSSYVREKPPMIPSSEIYPSCAEMVLDLPGLRDDFYSMPTAFCADTDRLAFILGFEKFTNADGVRGLGTQIYLYDRKQKQVSELFPHNALYISEVRPISVAFNKKGNLLVLAKRDGTIEGWDMRAVPPVKKLEVKPAQALGKTSVSIRSVVCSNGHIFAGDWKGRIYQIDPKTGNVVYTARRNMRQICNMVVSPNGKYLAVGGDDNKLVVYSTESLEPIHEFQMNSGIRAIAFDPELNTRIAVGGGENDKRICIFDFY
jgi:hypothetical protein